MPYLMTATGISTGELKNESKKRKQGTKTMQDFKARTLGTISYAAWACADPGIQFIQL
jgi:hypothetical protein